MKVYPYAAVNRFSFTDEVLNNPYMGFLEFNGAGENEIFIETSNKSGWIKECYPISSDRYADKNALAAEGLYYPEGSTSYFRFLWKKFEPKEGEYDYGFIEEILEKCRLNGKTAMLRIMPHTTRDDENVPDWLLAKIDCPFRPEDKRVKGSPESRLFYEKFAAAITAFAKKYDGDRRIYAVDISLCGAWGEGDGIENVPFENLALLVDAYTHGFKKTNLLMQFLDEKLVKYACKTRPVGVRADGLGNPWHMYDGFPPKFKAYDKLWKKQPVSFEAFWYLSEWKNQGWDVKEIIRQSLKWHVSTFNGKSSSVPLEWKEYIDEWLIKMGYRFAVRNVRYPEEVVSGDTAVIRTLVENAGVAPLYDYVPLRLRLKNDKDEKVYNVKTDARKWQPGDSFENFELNTKGLSAGDYTLSVSLGGFDGYPLIKFAMNAVNDGVWYDLAEIKIK